MSSNKTGVSSEENDANSSWTKEGTKLLLKHYAERKHKFCDPRIKKKTLWIQIVKEFKMEGHYVTTEMLDRKMRNLKHFYRRVRENRDKKTGRRKKISWEWYELMENIFGKSEAIDTALASINSPKQINNDEKCILSSNLCAKEEICSDEMEVEEDVDEPPCQTASTTNSSLDNTLNDLPNRKSKKQKCTRAKALYHLRRKQFECEEKRIIAIQELKEAISEHNDIQRERNEILRHIIQSSRIVS